MPKSCAHFKHLSERVEALSEKFVNDQVANELADPIGFQPDLDRLAAYRLLVHAEIEQFLEAKATENILEIKALAAGSTAWMRAKPALLLLAIALSRPLPSHENLDVTKFGVYVRELIAGAKSAISENNGVKSASFLKLSIFAGKTIDEIDEVLSASLNSYGKDRGDVAHKSAVHSRSLNAPSMEQATAKQLVAQISQYFDVCP